MASWLWQSECLAATGRNGAVLALYSDGGLSASCPRCSLLLGPFGRCAAILSRPKSSDKIKAGSIAFCCVVLLAGN